MANLQLVAEHTGAHPDFPVAAALYKLHKSFLLLVSDQPEFGIGTVAISGPPTDLYPNATSSPLSSFGLKNNMLTNLVGKTASKSLMAPVLSLVLIKNTSLKQEVRLKAVMSCVIGLLEAAKVAKE